MNDCLFRLHRRYRENRYHFADEKEPEMSLNWEPNSVLCAICDEEPAAPNSRYCADCEIAKWGIKIAEDNKWRFISAPEVPVVAQNRVRINWNVLVGGLLVLLCAGSLWAFISYLWITFK